MYKIIFVILVCYTTHCFAQESNKEVDVLITDQERFITLSQITNIASQNSPNLAAIEVGINNAIFIQQIGVNNSVVSTIDAESSTIRINQEGNENNIELEESALEIEKLISQTGNNNRVFDVSINPGMSTSLELIQEGNNLIFERFGTNELTKSLKFRMAGDAQTIIVRSF
ncbi:hypothetical protein J8281_01495 [Aquimarina sp. U1-2]|uniref:hypothetical protein n=1 Tax=Aquimarina sp. U1-2 TaxID=2823141 RepID=UPI001AECDF01|nr:hypothetical protein [Aquimarina sp. U1-2]MBP2830846.1 hypothetical protein [Aquimarina sp. U1-2]